MTKYSVNKGFITQKFGDKTVIFDGEKSALYTLNQTASYILKITKSGLSEDEIIEKLIKRYGIKEKTARKDVNEIISGITNELSQ